MSLQQLPTATTPAPAQPPLFSIATPARNALSNLRRCAGSVRGQQGVRWEHLVQDAGSIDGTPVWLQQQAQRDPSFKPVSAADDGMYDGINRAWARAGGDVFAWLNADEQYLPCTLSRVAAHFAAHPEVDVLFGDYIVADADGRPVALRREIPLRAVYVANSFLNAQSCTLFFRRRLHDAGLLQFDTRYRYAADKDMVLRLLAAGAVFRHVREYWSIFGVDGNNLSTHARMQTEAEQVRLAHGALRLKPLRQLALAGRRVERLLRGAYRRDAIVYRFAVDETPRYVELQAHGLGGRYSLADVEGRASSVRPVHTR